MQIKLKMQNIIYTNSLLVKMMKVYPENNLGGKDSLQEINNKIDI